MRNIRRTVLATLTIAVLAALTARLASASTIEVGTCPVGDADDGQISAHYSTIQAAVNAAAPGSKVLVCPGTYAEQVEITKPLTLKGVRSSNRGASVIIPPPTGLIVPPAGFTSSAPQIFAHDIAGEVNVSNLTVDASNNQVTNCSSPSFIIGVYLLNAGGSIENVVTRNQNTASASSCGNGAGIRVYGHAIPSDVTIRNNTLSAYDGVGILAQGTLAKVMIHNNSFVEMPGSAGIILFDGLVTTVSENTVAGNPNAFSGILVNGVSNAIVTHNHVGNDAYGITLYTFTGFPNSDGNTITENEVFGSGTDGIAVCGDNNLIQGNTISGSTESGVNLTTGAFATFGAQCTSNNNTVTENSISGACTGVLVDPAASGNRVSDDNSLFNAVNLQLTGTTCPLTATKVATKNLKAAHTLPVSARLAMR